MARTRSSSSAAGWPAPRRPRRCATEGFDGPRRPRRRGAERPYERPPLSKGYLLGKADRESPLRARRRLVRRARRRAAHRRARHAARPRRPTGSTLDAGEQLPLRRSCCWPPAPRRGGCRCPAPTWTASATCARSPTPTGCAPTSRGGGTRVVDRRRRLDRPGGRRGGPRSTATRSPSSSRSRRRCTPCSARRWAACSPGCTASTASTCAPAPASREFRGDGGRRGAGRRLDDGERARRPTSSSSASAPRPNVELAEAAGLEVDNGVVTDAALRTSDPDVFAAGDVAVVVPPAATGGTCASSTGRTRCNGGPAAARSMLGQDVSYDRVPYFFTDQYDLGMEYSGPRRPRPTPVVCRGDPDDGEFIAFWLAGRPGAARR